MPSKMTLEEHNNCKVLLDTKPSKGISKNKCVICKGRSMCGISPCPILSSIELDFKGGNESKNEFHGKSTGLNIGWEKYPNDTIYMSMLSEDYDPKAVFENERESVYYKLSKIFSPFIGSNIPQGIQEEFKKIAISRTPLKVDVNLSGMSSDKFFFSSVERAFGNIGPLYDLNVYGDPDIPLFLIEIMEQGLEYEQAIARAYEDGAEIEYISRLLATGNLGKPQRPMPSRWAKTSTYSVCSKHLIGKVKKLPVSRETAVYHNNYLGNDYLIIGFSRPWEFEMIERWLPNSIWTIGEEKPLYVHEHETYNGVSDQAMREGGSYYSGRLGTCELLMRGKEQAACLVMFLPSPESSVPFGSGEIRMGIRGSTLLERFENDEDAIEFACTKMQIPSKEIKKMSMLLSQNSLNKWM